MCSQGGESARPLARCSSLQRDILITLAMTGSASGVEILTKIREFYNEEEVTLARSTLYHHLGRLEAKGLVIRRGQSRRTNEYELSWVAQKRLGEYREWVTHSTDSLYTGGD